LEKSEGFVEAKQPKLVRRLPHNRSFASAPSIHFERKNPVGQALRLPQFFDGSSSSGSRFAGPGATGYLLRYNLRRQSRTGLANERAFGAFKAAVAKLQHWTVLAAVLMPDHLHIIASRTDARDTKLGNFSAALKRWIRRELDASWNWQPGCFDRLLRSDESLHEKWFYIEDNPVRAGLVKRPADWPYRIGLAN
jgi:REP element-mobilizing transposase RayT